MRLLIIGTLSGQIGSASQIAIERGAKVQQADTVDTGLGLLGPARVLISSWSTSPSTFRNWCNR